MRARERLYEPSALQAPDSGVKSGHRASHLAVVGARSRPEPRPLPREQTGVQSGGVHGKLRQKHFQMPFFRDCEKVGVAHGFDQKTPSDVAIVQQVRR